MAISVFPAAVSSSLNASAITCASNANVYEAVLVLDPGIYTVTCASATVAVVDFFSSSNTLVTSATTASGTVAINIGSAIAKVRVFIDTGTNVVVTITKTASALTNIFSGTLDTVTATGTYTGTSTSGLAYAVLVGGGGGGGSYTDGANKGCGGGGSGGLAAKIVSLTGSMAVTIGAYGGGGNSGSAGSNGGASTFAGMTANGGSGSGGSSNGGAGGTATNGTYNSGGRAGSAGFEGFGPWGGDGGVPVSPYLFVVSSIGTGGIGWRNNTSTPATAGTGYGAGGGGAKTGYVGANGSPGVLYVLKF